MQEAQGVEAENPVAEATPEGDTPATETPNEEVSTPENEADSEQPATEEEQPTESEDDSTEEEATEDAAEEEGKEPEPTEAEKLEETYKKRTARQRAALKSANEKIEALNAQVREMQQRFQEFEVQQEPKVEDFDTYEEYNQAAIDYKVNQRLNEEKQKTESDMLLRQRQSALQEQERAFKAQEDALRTVLPDYDDVVQPVSDFIDSAKGNPVLPALEAAILTSENAPRFAYHMGQNPEILDSFLDMTPEQAYRKVVEIDLKLAEPSKKTVAQKTKQTPKPAPIKPSKGNSNPVRPLVQRTGKEVVCWDNS
mgnify:CR=1 FL=1